METPAGSEMMLSVLFRFFMSVFPAPLLALPAKTNDTRLTYLQQYLTKLTTVEYSFGASNQVFSVAFGFLLMRACLVLPSSS